MIYQIFDDLYGLIALRFTHWQAVALATYVEQQTGRPCRVRGFGVRVTARA